MKWVNHIWFKMLLIFFAAVLQYANTADHDYAWDDAIVLTENTRVQKGLKNVPELFENIKSNETQNRYGYRPISLLSFATDVQFFGMNPKASHKFNILYYGILCMLVFLFLQTLFPSSSWANLLVTMLFVVHPLHVEVVANIKSRDEILAMLFGLSSLLAYQQALLREKWFWYLVSVLLMIMAFLSKESAIAFCGIAFLVAWYTSKELDVKTVLKRIAPLMLLIFVLAFIRFFVYSNMFFQNNDMELYQKGIFHQDGFIGNPLFDANFSTRLATAIFLVSYFVCRFVIPYPLVHDYSYNQFSVMTWSNVEVWCSMILIIGFLYLLARTIRNRSTLAFGIAFFLITISIYLHLLQIAPDIYAERFEFVPSLGLCIMFLSLFELKIKPTVLYLLLGFTLVPMFAYSWNRNKVWKDNVTLLESDLPKLNDCVRANYNYALLLHSKYYGLPDSEKKQGQIQVLKYYERTFELTDRLFNVYMDLGAAYMEFGFPDKAKVVFEMAMVKYPDLSPPFVQMGKYYMSFSEYGKAIPYFEKALENGAKNSDFHYLLAICEFNTSKQDKAMETLLEGEKLGVSSSAYHSLIARLYLKLDQKEKAKAALERGLILYPYDQGLKNELNRIQTAD